LTKFIAHDENGRYENADREHVTPLAPLTLIHKKYYDYEFEVTASTVKTCQCNDV